MDMIAAIFAILWFFNPLKFLFYGSFGGLPGLIGSILGIGIILILLRLPVTRQYVRFALVIVPAIYLWFTGVIALLLWRPVSAASDFILRHIPLDRAISKLLLLPARTTDDALLTGDRHRFAVQVWQTDEFPDLYQAVPDDIRRPLYEDGRLLGGIGINWLADRHLTDNVYLSSVRAGFKAGVLAFLIALIFILLGTALSIFAFVPALFSGERPIIEHWPEAEPIRVSAWSLFAANFVPAIKTLLGQLGTLILYIPAAAMTSLGMAILISLVLLRVWLWQKNAPYELVTKDAQVRWPHRIESRMLIRRTYLKQIEHALGYLKGAPTFLVGTATGVLRTRGDLAAPVPGQSIMLDSESLFQHMLVFGGTGEGKTTALLKPVVAQVLNDRKFGAFVVDAKGVLWRDIEALAGKLGRSDDIVVIGTHDGAMGVNVMANLTPSQVASALRSVLTQVGGSNGDSFWPDMAVSVLRHALTIGLGYTSTVEGQDEANRSANPYSLWWAYQAVLRPPVLDAAIAAVRQRADELLALQQEAAKHAPIEEARATLNDLTAFMTSELSDSIAYMESAWLSMASETKTGIIAHVTSLLDGFGGNRALRERFASGKDAGAISIDAALKGKIVLIALSSVEDGLPARLVSILLKTSLYREARRREQAWKHSPDGVAPQDSPCLVVMDEVQELVTVDASSGLSDGTFWNVARSTGLAGLFATQTVSALRQAMGPDATNNFMQQARSKVFFRTEEEATIDYACWCAGHYERNRVFEEGQRESLDYRLLIDGWSPLHPVDEEESLSAGPHAFFEAAKSLLFPERLSISQAGQRAIYGQDNRFIAKDSTPGEGGGTAGNSAHMGSLQAAHWRSEDLTRSYLTHGNDIHPALTASDIIHMGRWHAFAHIQRAGAVRQDIIAVEHDFDA
jgi:hypothetical protein